MPYFLDSKSQSILKCTTSFITDCEDGEKKEPITLSVHIAARMYQKYETYFSEPTESLHISLDGASLPLSVIRAHPYNVI